MENTSTTNALSRMVRASAATTMTTRSRQNGRFRRCFFPSAGACSPAWASAGAGAWPAWLGGHRRSARQPWSAGGGVPAFLDPGGLAAQIPQVVELGTADPATGHGLDLIDRGAVHREGALDAHAVAHLADGERLPQAAALAPDHNTLEHLDPGAVAFLDPHVHLNGVTGAELRDVVADLGLLKLGDRGMHGGNFLSQSVLAGCAHDAPPGCKPSCQGTPRRSQRPNGQRSSVCHTFAVNRKASLNEHRPVARIQPVASREPPDQVRPPFRGPPQRLVPLPLRYRRLIPGQQHGRNLI